MSQDANSMGLVGPVWLLFMNSSLQVEHLLANIYIPIDSEFLVAQEELLGVFRIVEVYRVNRTQPLQIHRVATWSPQDGDNWEPGGLYERRQNFHGHVIRAITYSVGTCLCVCVCVCVCVCIMK